MPQNLFVRPLHILKKLYDNRCTLADTSGHCCGLFCIAAKIHSDVISLFSHLIEIQITLSRLLVDGPDSGYQHVDLPRGIGRQVQACPRLQSQVGKYDRKKKNYTRKYRYVSARNTGSFLINDQPSFKKIWFIFLCVYGGLECAGHALAYVGHLCFFKMSGSEPRVLS